MAHYPDVEAALVMYADYQRGQTLQQVGVKFHYSDMSVSRIFRHYDLPTRTPNQTRFVKTEAQTRRMYRDREAGMSLRAIGLKYGLSESAVWRRFKRLDLPTCV